MESKNDGHISAETVDEDWSLPLSFAHIRDDSTANTVREICHALGRHGNAHVLVDSLLQQVLGSSLHLSEHLLIFHWVLEGAEPEVTLLGRVIEGILELWEEIDKGSVYEICFVLCIIGNVAAKLSKSCDLFVIVEPCPLQEMILWFTCRTFLVLSWQP